MSRKIIGSFASVSFPELGNETVLAKVDTGAYSGALHCAHIQVKKQPDGTKVLRIKPFSDSNKVVQVADFTVSHVRSSSGHRMKRYIVETPIVIDGVSYTATIGLTDRTKMKFPVLIGRRFLRTHDFLVDTRVNQELDTDGGRTE